MIDRIRTLEGQFGYAPVTVHVHARNSSRAREAPCACEWTLFVRATGSVREHQARFTYSRGAIFVDLGERCR